MISWIQHHLIRHGRWIFLTLLAVVIIAFVGTIGNTPGCTTNRSSYQALDYYGYDLNSDLDMRPVGLRLSLSNQLNQVNLTDQQQLSNQMLARIAMLQLADTIGIPAPDTETIGTYLQEKPLFREPSGQFDSDRLTRFIDTIEANPSLPDGILVRVLEEDYRMQQIAERLSGPGYAMTDDARLQAQRYQTSYTLSTATIDYATFEPEIDAVDSELQTYYNQNANRYQIPERIQASYLHFKADTFLPQVGALEEDALREHFIANRARFVDAYETANPPADTEADTPAVKFEDVREAVSGDLRKAQALRLANQAAQNFAYDLYNKSIPRESAAFNEALNAAGLSLKPIEPFSASDSAKRGLPTPMLDAAFALSEARYFTDPYPMDNGFGVLIYQAHLPIELPPFKAVAQEVQADYAAEEKRRLFYQKGVELKKELEAQLAAGVSFADAATQLNLTIEKFEAFKLNEAPQNINSAAIQAAVDLKAGSVSAMLQSGSSGLFVFVADRDIPNLAADDETLQQATNFLKYNSAMIRMNALASELVERGMPKEQN
jgi:peptidyl-prolyl cis-trans isomerase D